MRRAGGGLTAGACLALCLTLAVCSKTPPPGPKIDPALYGLIPPDTTFMAGARLEDLEKTEIYKKYLAQRTIPQLGSPVDSFGKELGIDPRKDLWELLYVSNGKQSAFLGRGMFSDEGELSLKNVGGIRFRYKGFDLVGDDQFAVLLVMPTIAAAGDTAELKALVDAKDKGPGPGPALQAVMKEMPATAQIWAAYSGGPINATALPTTGNLSNLSKFAKEIQTGSFYLDLTNGINGVVTADGGTQPQADDLNGGVKALLGFGRLSTPPNRPELDKVWDGLRVTEQDRRVRLYLNEPPDVVDKALNLWVGKLPPR